MRVSWTVVRELTLLVLLALALEMPVRAAANDLLPEVRDREIVDFFEGPVQRWELIIPEESLGELRQSPRDYARANLQIGNQKFSNVGIHLKGSAGSKRSVDDRPALTVKFNRFRKGQRAFGMEKLHLNNSVQDSSTLNENFASRVYRQLGIPSTRATHAVLTINGRELGVYVVKESYDADYVRRHFPEDSRRPGNLYEGGFVGDVDRKLQRDAGQGPDDGSDLVRLRSALTAPIDERLAAMNRVLDVDSFMTLASIQLLLDDRDGYVRNRNNYRIYFRGTDGKALFLPSGMDQWLMHADAPIRDAWTGMVAQSLFGMPDQRIRLREHMRLLVGGPLSETNLVRIATQLQSRLEDIAEHLNESDRSRLAANRTDLPSRIRRRLAVVHRELAEWPDPMAPWPPGKTLSPSGWGLMVQTGGARSRTNQPAAGVSRTLYFVVEKPETRASFRTTITLPYGKYRLLARCRCQGLEAFEDRFGRGASVRITGSTATGISRLEGDRDWTQLAFDFEQPDDGPVELIAEVRANRGEAWFDLTSIRVEAR